jgi:hypothetical protein
MNVTRVSAMSLLLVVVGCGGVPPDPSGHEATLEESALTGLSPKGREHGVRLLSPLSATIATSQRPVLRWTGADHDAVRVDICRDRACDHRLESFIASGGSARPSHALPHGVVFWRVSASRREMSRVWELVIPARDSGRAGSWGAVPDFDGDGFADLAFTALGVGSPPPPSEVRVFPGGPHGPTATPTQTFQVGGLPFVINGLGDVDGDGFCDAGVFNFTTPPTLLVFRGGAHGLAPPTTITLPDTTAGSGQVSTAGDVNDDGYADFLVGGQAAAQLFLGGPRGPRDSGAGLVSQLGDAERTVGGADFDGDGQPDAIIGSNFGGTRFFAGDGHTLVGRDPLPFDFAELAGDFNGDGLGDVASRSISVGGPGGPNHPFQTIDDVSFYSGVGDANGDGFSDAVGNLLSSGGVVGLRVYFGARQPCPPSSCTRFVQLSFLDTVVTNTALDQRGVGDVNGDGFDDIAVLSPFTGTAWVLFGSPAGPPPLAPSRTLTFEQGFGYAVAHL